MFLHILDPLDGLSLRVDHERPTVALCHNHTVLCGEGIRGETLDVPISNCCWLGQEGGKREVGCTRNV